MDGAADFFVAADDGVELAAAGELGEVFGVLFERLELALGGLVGDAGGAADGGEGLEDGLVRGAEGLEGGGDGAAFFVGQAEQQVLGGAVFVLEIWRPL